MKRPDEGQRGMALVIVMVLIAVLFLTGTVMALVVSSSLHTVEVAANQDAIHYAAESGVARAVAVAAQTPSCALKGTINNQPFTATCQAPIRHVADPVRLQSFAGGVMQAGQCHSWQSFPQVTSGWKAVWTVVGWRSLGAASATVSVWFDDSVNCTAPPQPKTLSPAYVVADPSFDDEEDIPVLHIRVTGGSIALGNFALRAASEASSGALVTVFGQSGVEVDEADVVLPNTLKFWNTVLP